MAQVSLLVLNYNGKKFLETVLPSIQRQTFQDTETILIDNGSTDDSVDYVRENFPDVRILQINPNIGYSRAVNYGFRHATSKYSVLISNDNRLDEHCIENLVRAIRQDEDGIYSTRNMDFYRPELIDDVGGTNNILGYPIAIGHHEPMRQSYAGVRPVFAFCGNIFMAKPETFLKLGGFDEHHFGFLEDSDLGWRARLRGYRSYCVSDAIAYHMLSATWGKDSPAKRFFMERNRLYMVVKNYATSTLLKLLPLLFAFEIGKFFFFLLTGNLSQCRILLRAYWWNLSHIGLLFRQRKINQKKRTKSDGDILPLMETGFIGASSFGVKYKSILRILSQLIAAYSRIAFGTSRAPALTYRLIDKRT